MALDNIGLENITNMFMPNQAKFQTILKEVTNVYGTVFEPLNTAFSKPKNATEAAETHYYFFKPQTQADEKRDLNSRFNAWLIGDAEIAKFSVLRLVFITLSFIYLPMCTYIVTCKGYSVGGTDLNDFPYSNNKTSGSGLIKEFSETYKQLGGGKCNQKGGASGISSDFLYGPYRTVQFPYTLADKSYTDYNALTFFMLWIIESTASSFCMGRQLLDAMLSIFKTMGVGFDPAKSPNERMMSFAKCFLAAIPFMTLIPLMTAFLPIYNMIQLLVRVPNRLWPFVGNRTFSTVFIFIILTLTVVGITAYITILTTSLTTVSTALTAAQH